MLQGTIITTLLLAAPATGAGTTGEIRGDVSIVRRSVGSKDPTLDQVFLFLEDAPTTGQKPRGSYSIRQSGKRFIPNVLVVPTGSSVAFPNEDAVAHNVFSVTPSAAFDLGLYPAGSSKSATFDKPGIVAVYCNIHPQMIAYVIAVANPFHTFAAADGHFAFNGLPPGTYHLVAWFRHGMPVRKEVVVKPNGVTDLQVVVHERADAGRHDTKTGAPYGRY